MNNHLVRQIQTRMDTLKLNPKALSLKAKLNETGVRDILEGRSKHPRTDTVAKIAKALGCAVADLTGEAPSRERAKVDSVRIFELDVRAFAGLGTDNDNEPLESPEAIVGTYTFPANNFREAYGAQPDGVRLIAVRGDSMIPVLFPGQRVMVDTTDQVPSPPGVFVIWDGMGLVLKRIELILGSDPPSVRISSDNKNYQTYERTLEEISINGRVIGVWARM